MLTTHPHPAPPRLKLAAARHSARTQAMRLKARMAMVAKAQARVLSDAEVEELKGELAGRIWRLE